VLKGPIHNYHPRGAQQSMEKISQGGHPAFGLVHLTPRNVRGSAEPDDGREV
jgi:hypothetical protein